MTPAPSEERCAYPECHAPRDSLRHSYPECQYPPELLCHPFQLRPAEPAENGGPTPRCKSEESGTNPPTEASASKARAERISIDDISLALQAKDAEIAELRERWKELAHKRNEAYKALDDVKKDNLAMFNENTELRAALEESRLHEESFKAALSQCIEHDNRDPMTDHRRGCSPGGCWIEQIARGDFSNIHYNPEVRRALRGGTT